MDILDKYRDINVNDPYWHDCLIEEFKEQLTIAGFIDITISFSGFWSQGDGLSFTGRYDTNYMASGELYYESVREFCRIAKQKHCYFNLVKQSHFYQHENTVIIDSNLSALMETHLLELCRDIMQEFYRTLEQEYTYLISDEAIKETLEINNITE